MTPLSRRQWTAFAAVIVAALRRAASPAQQITASQVPAPVNAGVQVKVQCAPDGRALERSAKAHAAKGK